MVEDRMKKMCWPMRERAQINRNENTPTWIRFGKSFWAVQVSSRTETISVIARLVGWLNLGCIEYRSSNRFHALHLSAEIKVGECVLTISAGRILASKLIWSEGDGYGECYTFILYCLLWVAINKLSKNGCGVSEYYVKSDRFVLLVIWNRALSDNKIIKLSTLPPFEAFTEFSDGIT